MNNITLIKTLLSSWISRSFFVFVCFFNSAAQATIQVQVEPSKIIMDETFKLNLTQDNPKYNGNPDLSPLRHDFIILGSSRNEAYSLINQQSQHTLIWTVFLKPRKEGILTIPSLKVNGEKTNPLTINVTANTSASTSSSNTTQAPTSEYSKPVFLTVEVSQKKPFINQQVLYTVKIYNAKQLLDANYEPPQVDNALVVPLPGKRYQTQKDNTPYLVEELSYAIFPQKSGPLTIKPPIFTALVYDYQPQRIKTKNAPLTLNVNPIPTTNTAKTWLPAKDIQLTENYESGERNFSQGSTLVRNLTLKGIGVPAQLLPTLSFESTEALSVYPEKGKEQNQIVQGDIVGQSQMKITYLFNQSGSITIPELTITWFNTQTGQEQSTKLPPRTFQIKAANSNLNPTTNSSEPNVQSPPSPPPPMFKDSFSIWPWFVAAFFAIAWLITLRLWRVQKTTPKTIKTNSKKVLNLLHQACLNNNPQEARKRLLQWAKEQWPDLSFLNLNDLFTLIHDSTFKKQIQLLSQALYQESEGQPWHGEALWQSVQQFKKPRTTAQQKSKDALPPLNPKI